MSSPAVAPRGRSAYWIASSNGADEAGPGVPGFVLRKLAETELAIRVLEGPAGDPPRGAPTISLVRTVLRLVPLRVYRAEPAPR